MNSIDILDKEKDAYDKLVSHPLQSYEWGEFRKRNGITVIRKGIVQGNKLVDGFQLTIHQIPHSPWTIGYLPKGCMPTKETTEMLLAIGKAYRCIFIQVEPNVIASESAKETMHAMGFRNSTHPLFTKYTFILDLTQSEETILQKMHGKTRYNIKIAQKYGVAVQEDFSEQAFSQYLSLTEETAKRQRFFAHNRRYHELLWESIGGRAKDAPGGLHEHLLTATYQGKTLVAWMLFVFKDTLYYPYGASSSEYRQTMASTLMMFEAIRFGKQHNLKRFDMWGAASTENPALTDPYYGFHRFKQGFSPTYTEFVGSFDLVINQPMYAAFRITDKLRWFLLRAKR